MKRSTIGIIIAIVLLVGGGIVLAMNSGDSTDNTAKTETTNDTMAGMNMANSSDSSNKTASDTPAAANEVVIKDFAFAPTTLTVKKGTKVTWTNKDDARHDISPTSGADDFKASKLLAKDESYSFTFNTVGTYEYKCSPHPYMKGKVVVME